MAEHDPHSTPWYELSRAGRRRLDRELTERAEHRLASRDAFLETRLEQDEVIVARPRRGGHPLITDRRILMAHQLSEPPGQGEWVVSSLAFVDVSRWAVGRQHDHRPLLALEHQPLVRIGRVPAHRLLWFEWGDTEGPVTHTTTSFGFARDTDPVLVAICHGLERAHVPRGDAFAMRPAGTREERMQGSLAYLTRVEPGQTGTQGLRRSGRRSRRPRT